MSVNSKSHNQLKSLEARHGTNKKLNDGSERTDKISNEKIYIADFLALTTYYTRKNLAILSVASRKLKEFTCIKWVKAKKVLAIVSFI